MLRGWPQSSRANSSEQSAQSVRGREAVRGELMDAKGHGRLAFWLYRAYQTVRRPEGCRLAGDGRRCSAGRPPEDRCETPTSTRARDESRLVACTFVFAFVCRTHAPTAARRLRLTSASRARFSPFLSFSSPSLLLPPRACLTDRLQQPAPAIAHNPSPPPLRLPAPPFLTATRPSPSGTPHSTPLARSPCRSCPTPTTSPTPAPPVHTRMLMRTPTRTHTPRST